MAESSSTDDRIPVKCPHCGREYDVFPELAGLEFPCRYCNERFTPPKPPLLPAEAVERGRPRSRLRKAARVLAAGSATMFLLAAVIVAIVSIRRVTVTPAVAADERAPAPSPSALPEIIRSTEAPVDAGAVEDVIRRESLKDVCLYPAIRSARTKYDGTIWRLTGRPRILTDLNRQGYRIDFETRSIRPKEECRQTALTVMRACVEDAPRHVTHIWFRVFRRGNLGMAYHVLSWMDPGGIGAYGRTPYAEYRASEMWMADLVEEDAPDESDAQIRVHSPQVVRAEAEGDCHTYKWWATFENLSPRTRTIQAWLVALDEYHQPLSFTWVVLSDVPPRGSAAVNAEEYLISLPWADEVSSLDVRATFLGGTERP